MNIRVEYLYRDAGNFKNWGEIIFSNPNNIDIKVIEKQANDNLLENLYFIAAKADVPDLHFSDHNLNLDHLWHEINSFELTTEKSNDNRNRTIEEFVDSLKAK
jgi:predicted nucleic acid-binding protein